MSWTWKAYPVIEGDTYHVVIEQSGLPVADLAPDVAQGLADQLNDAAHEPDWCMRSDCPNYATEGDLCGECLADPRTAPRWRP